MADVVWRLSVLTLNLWNINEPVQLRMNRLIDYLRAEPADVVALQEVSRVGERLQSKIIATHAGYPFVSEVLRTHPPLREEGLAILTQEPIRPWPFTELPKTPLGGGRLLQRVSLRRATSGQRMVVANTHLSYHRRDSILRQAEAQKIRNVVTRVLGKTPVVLCGDLNDTPDSQTLSTLRGAGALELIDAWEAGGDGSTGLTFSSRNRWVSPALWPDRRIDYVLTSSDVTVRTCEVVLTDAGFWRPVSDHYGVRALLEVGIPFDMNGMVVDGPPANPGSSAAS